MVNVVVVEATYYSTFIEEWLLKTRKCYIDFSKITMIEQFWETIFYIVEAISTNCEIYIKYYSRYQSFN